jgi:hypothetical protein
VRVSTPVPAWNRLDSFFVVRSSTETVPLA